MRKSFILILTLALLAMASVPVMSQASRTRFNWIITDTLTVNGDATVGDDLTVADDLSVADDASIGGMMTYSAATEITVTDGAAFAPTGTYQPITAAGEVTPTITVGSAGQMVVIVNTSAQTVNIADTSTTMLTAAAALGQYDTITILSDGTNWLEVSRADN